VTRDYLYKGQWPHSIHGQPYRKFIKSAASDVMGSGNARALAVVGGCFAVIVGTFLLFMECGAIL
jgi:hypothetical protein